MRDKLIGCRFHTPNSIGSSLIPAIMMKIWLARLFGKKVVGIDSANGKDVTCKMWGYWHKDVLFITGYKYFN